MNILKGQRFPLAQLGSNSIFQIGLQISGSKEAIDFACFGLDVRQKLSNDLYMTFFNQPKTPCGAIELSPPIGDFAQLDKVLTEDLRLWLNILVARSLRKRTISPLKFHWKRKYLLKRRN